MHHSVFSLNVGKYAPEITPYLDTFHTVGDTRIIHISREYSAEKIF